jgi:hypothetical protein
VFVCEASSIEQQGSNGCELAVSIYESRAILDSVVAAVPNFLVLAASKAVHEACNFSFWKTEHGLHRRQFWELDVTVLFD